MTGLKGRQYGQCSSFRTKDAGTDAPIHKSGPVGLVYLGRTQSTLGPLQQNHGSVRLDEIRPPVASLRVQQETKPRFGKLVPTVLQRPQDT